MSVQALRQPFTPEEQKLYTQIFQSLDVEQLGIVTGDKARSTFEKSGLPPAVLGEIWQLADPTNLGFLNQFAFFVALRLIGHVQSGSKPDKSLIDSAGPIPRFAGIQTQQTGSASSPQQLDPQLTSLPVLTNHDISKFAQLFTKNAPSGIISGNQARTIFLKAKLPTQVLGQIWNLVDKSNAGQLSKDEFTVAMYLIQNTLNGSISQLPTSIPQSIWDQVNNFQSPAQSQSPVATNQTGNQRPPVSRVPSSFANASNDWIITPQKKQQFSSIFDGLDKDSKGVLGPNEIAPFLMTSKLPQDVLATIWDLADIHNSGEFTKDEFAIAMFLVQKKIAGVELPHVIPDSLLPENHGANNEVRKAIPQIPSRDTKPSALDDLVELNDVFSAPNPVVGLSDQRNISNSSVKYTPTGSKFVPTSSFGQGLAEKDVSPIPAPAIVSAQAQPQAASVPSPVSAPAPQQKSTFTSTTSTFKPMVVVPNISLGSSGTSRSVAPVNNDLLADSNPEVSGQLSKTTTDLANLSTQIGSLTNQTSQLHEKRARAEQELAKMTALKADIESKLASLRTAYDQEVQKTSEVESLLVTVRAETESLRQEASVAEAQSNQVQTNLQAVQKELEDTQLENTTLKEQLATWNSQHIDLQAQLEKAQSDVKQSRGFVAINTKQLDVNNIKSQDIQQEIESLLASAKELDSHHENILSKQSDLETRKSQLEQDEAEFAARETEFAERVEQQKQTQVLIEEQDNKLQQLVADLTARKGQFDEAEAQLNQQQMEYAQRVQEFSYKQIQDATTGFTASTTESKSIEPETSGLSSAIAGAAFGTTVGAVGLAATSAITETEGTNEPVPSINPEFPTVEGTDSISSSVQNNAPQSVSGDVDEADQDEADQDEEQPALASEVLSKGAEASDSGAGSFELVGDEAKSESESTLKTAVEDKADEIADDLEAAIPGAWASNTTDQTIPVVAAATTLNSNEVSNDEEFPPIKELEINESDSEAEEFHETIDSVPSPVKSKIESTAAVVPVAAPVFAASSLTQKPADLDDEFAGLEEAKEEKVADIQEDDFAGLEAAEEDGFADYDEDEFAEQNDFDQELEGNQFFGGEEGESPTGQEDNEEWEQIFAGFGNQGQAPVQQGTQLQQPTPTYHNGEGSSAARIKGRVATTPRSLAIQELTGMGFTEQEALNALEKEKWNLEAATNFLLDNA